MTRRIIASGLRNPFRIAVRPGGEVWTGDVGWTQWEEINRIPAPTTEVRNFGWPCYEGAGRMSSYDNANLNVCESLYAEGAAAHSGPHYAYSHDARVVPGEACAPGSSSISAIAFYTGTQFPARYRNGLFFGDYVRSCIWFMPLGANGQPDPAQRETFASGAEGVVGLTVGPDGSLYYPDIISGEIKRITYPTANAAPTARVTTSATTGPTPLTVQFDGRGSSDADGGALSYAWDLDGDGAFDDGTGDQASWTYVAAGQVSARLRVTDPGGLEDVATVAVRAGSPPTARIDTPAAGFTWAVGDQITFAGGGDEAEGGAVPAAGMTWRLLLQHCAEGQPENCHTHVLQTWPGVAGGSVVAPDHEYPSYLELELTVTGAAGLTDVVKRRLDPKTVDLTFETSPSGLQLSVGSHSGAAPFTRTVIVGSTQTVSAPGPQTSGGSSYGFTSWSDAGAQNHAIVAPAAPATYRATFTQLATQPGLVGAWGLDEPSGSQAVDASGRGGTGTLDGATRATGRFGGAVSFDGLNDWVTVADAPALRLAGGMTLEAWVNPASLGSGWRTALLKERGAGLAYALYASNGANRAASFLNIGGADTSVLSAAAVPAGAWTHVATTYDGAMLRMYVNGSQVATRAQTGVIDTSTGPLRFGGNGAWLNEFFNGRLDEIRVYDRALTAAQVAADMTTPIGAGPPPTPALSVTPSSLSFAGSQGGASPAAKSLTIANTGGGTLSYSVADDAAWLSVAPAGGTAPQSVSASVDLAGLAPGTHTATITVTAGGAQGSPAAIPVSLTVAAAPPPPALSVTPASLAFSGTQGGANPAAQPLAVANSGGGTLSYTASDDASWLSVTPASGTAPQSMAVSASVAGLTPGTYSGTVTVTAAGAQNSPVAIPVTLTVAAAPPPTPALAVAPASLAFTAQAGGAAPAARTIDVTNAGGGALSFTAADNATWLTVSPASGTAPQSLTASVSQAGLAAGVYSATVTITAPGATGSPKTVAVTLTVSAPPATGGLVAAYGFDESSGATATDASGAGNPGVVSGATRAAAGRSGGALEFDGVNDWVTVADAASLDLTTGMSLEAWVYPTAAGTAWRTVILKERPAGLAYAIYGNDDTGRPDAFAYTGSDFSARGTSALPLNTWSHVAATYSARTLRLYVGGVQVATRTAGTALRTSDNPLRIGGNAIWNEWFQGRIDEVRVYNRALTAAEIQADMTRPVTTAALMARKPGARVARRQLRRARRHMSVRLERKRRGLPLRSHKR